MQLIINLIFLSKSDIWRASDFPISSRSLPFSFFPSFCSSYFFFANAAAHREWAILHSLITSLVMLNAEVPPMWWSLSFIVKK